MLPALSLAPRYRLDDESPWLEGVDPLRRYWINVNGDPAMVQVLPGLQAKSWEGFKQAIRAFRNLAIGETLALPTELGDTLTIHCVAENCFAIAPDSPAAPVWHLFDRESLESLLMTAHPDWQCAPQHLNLGRSVLMAAWGQAVAANAA